MVVQPTAVELSAVVRKEGDLYVATCPEFDVTSQGKSVEEALELYLEDKDVESPSKGDAPIVTMVRVNVRGAAGNLRSRGN